MFSSYAADLRWWWSAVHNGFALAGNMTYCRYHAKTWQQHARYLSYTSAGQPRRTVYFLPKKGLRNGKAILHLHGGGFTSGKPEFMEPLVRSLLNDGFVLYSAEYALLPKGTITDSLRDVYTAIEQVSNHMSGLGVEKGKLFLIGSSAGGYLASMAALADPDALNIRRETPRGNIAGWVSLFGPSSLARIGRDNVVTRGLSDRVFHRYVDRGLHCDPSLAEKWDAGTYVHSNAPRSLFLHGDEDRVVDLSHSSVLHEQLRKVGATSHLLCGRGLVHVDVRFNHSHYRQQVRDFLVGDE